MLVLLAFLTRAMSCPIYDCENIDTGYCAILADDQTVKFATVACPDSSGCSLLEILNFAWVGVAGCSIDLTTEVGTNFTSGCIDRPTGNDLVLGSHPKECISNTDCLIQNGNYSSCVCSFDGLSFCQPEFGSKAFDFYWDECNEHNATVSRGEYLTLINLMYSYYVYTIKTPPCMIQNIFELSRIREIAIALGLNATEIPILRNDSDISMAENGGDGGDGADGENSSALTISLAIAYLIA